MFDQELGRPAGGLTGATTTTERKPEPDTKPEQEPAAQPRPLAQRRSSPTEDRSGSSRVVRVLRAAAVAILVSTLVIVALANDLVPGPVAAGALVLLVLAIPTSAQLSRRILLAGCLFFGWIPLLYWWALPVGGLGRCALLLGVVAGLLAGWIAAGSSPRRRLKRLVPTFRVIDGLPLLAGLATAAMLWKWLQAKTGVSALSLMIPGWDNSAHYAMTHSIRLHGVTTQGLDAASGGQASSFDGYPQNFHASVASVMELLGDAGPGTAESEIVLYTQSVGLALVAAITMLCAGLCALPALRRRPAAAVPLVSIVGSAFVLGPGGSALHDGFPNFLLAAILVAAIPLITVPLHRPLNLWHVVALGGAVVGVAHGWAPLLLLALPGVLVTLLPWRRRRWVATRSTVLVTGLVVAATAGCLVFAAAILSNVPLEALTTAGGVSPPPLGLGLLFIMTCLAGCLLTGRSRSASSQTRTDGTASRTTWMATLPIIGLLGAVALAAYQLSSGGEVAYYFWKFVSALILASVVLLAACVVGLISRIPVQRGQRVRTVAIAAVLSIAATQVFGIAGPDLPSNTGPVPKAPGAEARGLSEQWIADPFLSANMIMVVDRLSAQFPGRPIFYIAAPTDGRNHPYSSAQWFLGLTDTWSFDAQATVPDAVLRGPSIGNAIAAAQRVLLANERNVVAVGPEIVEEVRRAVGPEYADRVVSW